MAQLIFGEEISWKQSSSASVYFLTTPGKEEYLASEESKKHVLSKIVLGKIGEPKDVANAVLFLASPAASLITGTTPLIDGGWTNL